MWKTDRTKLTKADRFKDRIITVALVISFLLFIGSISQTSKKIRIVDEEVADRQQELEKLKKEEAELKAKLEEVTSEEYMESQLSNQLNMARENEIVLVIPED